MGGPSLYAKKVNLKELSNRFDLNIIESRAITPYLLRTGYKPDVIFVSEYEKLTHNAFHNFILRSVQSRIDLSPFLSIDFLENYRHLMSNYNDVFEVVESPWVHKRIRFKSNSLPVGSPARLVAHWDNVSIIAPKHCQTAINQLGLNGDIFYFMKDETCGAQVQTSESLARTAEAVIKISSNNSTNSAGISLFPVLDHIHLKRAYFLGLDLSMMGAMEFSADRIFKTKLHFYYFMFLARRSFGANFRLNWPLFLRPKSDINGLLREWNVIGRNYIRVYEHYAYTHLVESLTTMPLCELQFPK